MDYTCCHLLHDQEMTWPSMQHPMNFATCLHEEFLKKVVVRRLSP